MTVGREPENCPSRGGPEWLTETVTKHIIVDGSNIATEGRAEPSLAQLDEAVTALMAEYKNSKVTVIVDATFGHRIAKKERAEFDKAVANNELVTPPAGAVGRGDAFILAIADKVNAAIFSNDSFQEFHGKYKWLFDEGRLIGGKPVPLVGWVFVERLPVRGPTSRRSVKQGGVVAKKIPSASPEASKPMPVPKSPPPNARLAKSGAVEAKPAAPTTKQTAAKQSGTMANDVVSYLEFVEKHPVGTKVKAIVETYAANGVTVRIGDVAGYVPIKNMATPIPRSARDVFTLGDAVTLMVVGYTASRRSVDLGVPSVVADQVEMAAKKEATKKDATKNDSTKKDATKKDSTRKSPAKKRATKASTVKKSAAAKTTEPNPVIEKSVTKKSAEKKVAGKKPVEKKTATKKQTAKAAPTPKPSVSKSAAKKASVSKPAANKSATDKSTVRKAAARKPAEKKPAEKKSVSKKPAAKKPAAKKASTGTTKATTKK